MVRFPVTETNEPSNAAILNQQLQLNSPAFTGNPTAPTQPVADNSTKLATTAYADRAGAGANAAIALSLVLGG